MYKSVNIIEHLSTITQQWPIGCVKAAACLDFADLYSVPHHIVKSCDPNSKWEPSQERLYEDWKKENKGKEEDGPFSSTVPFKSSCIGWSVTFHAGGIDTEYD